MFFKKLKFASAGEEAKQMESSDIAGVKAK